MSELQGASLPRPLPLLYPGPTGELTATPRPPAEFSNDLWSLHVVPMAQLPQDWEFFLFSYWDWDFGLFQCWELRSEPPFRTLMNGPIVVLLLFQACLFMYLCDVEQLEQGRIGRYI